MSISVPILFLAGPSGTGKSTLCEFAADHCGWLAYDLDVWKTDALALHGLKDHWSHYRNTGDCGPLARLLVDRASAAAAGGVVLGFPGGFTPPLSYILKLRPAVTVLYLSGTPELCRAAFRQREQTTGRGLPDSWWDTSNLDLRVQGSGERLFDYLELPELKPYVLPMFTGNGERRPMADIWDDVIRLATGS
jgi:hypothetical protein